MKNYYNDYYEKFPKPNEKCLPKIGESKKRRISLSPIKKKVPLRNITEAPEEPAAQNVSKLLTPKFS